MASSVKDILLKGLLSARPTADATNHGYYYWASDVNGGTLYQNQDGSSWTQITSGISEAAAGTVTSVGLSMPSDFSVGGSPVTTSGTLAVTANNQSANTVKAGPASGAAAAPTYRALVPADLPLMGPSGPSHQAGAVPDPGSSAGTTRYLREDRTWDVPPGGLSGVTIEEEDGTPNVASVTTIKVTNGTLTDHGSGVVSVTTGGGSGASPPVSAAALVYAYYNFR